MISTFPVRPWNIIYYQNASRCSNRHGPVLEKLPSAICSLPRWVDDGCSLVFVCWKADYVVERYDPSTRQWSHVAPMTSQHSTAGFLGRGRSGGGNFSFSFSYNKLIKSLEIHPFLSKLLYFFIFDIVKNLFLTLIINIMYRVGPEMNLWLYTRQSGFEKVVSGYPAKYPVMARYRISCHI